MEVVTDKPQQRRGLFRYCNFTDGSESYPGHTLRNDIKQENEHAEVGMERESEK